MNSVSIIEARKLVTQLLYECDAPVRLEEFVFLPCIKGTDYKICHSGSEYSLKADTSGIYMFDCRDCKYTYVGGIEEACDLIIKYIPDNKMDDMLCVFKADINEIELTKKYSKIPASLRNPG